MINQYTKESGVRQLERVIAKLMRKVIQIILKDSAIKSVEITDALLKEWLGNPPYRKTSLSTATDRLGLATGLAWTEVGGDVLEIEASAISGKGSLTLTGQLGEVMQESAQAALSYIRAKSNVLGLPTSFYTNKDLHIHIPEGATPKDGPSAGTAMCTALISILTKNPTRNDLAMTGEITLQGRILAIGGVKEKLLAAKQHAIKRVIIPHENYDDVQEVLKETDLQGLEIIFVRTMDEILDAAFEVSPLTRAKELVKAKRARKKTK